MSTDAHSLTGKDIEFLGRPRYGFLSVADGPTPTQSRPVWFEVRPENDRAKDPYTEPDYVACRPPTYRAGGW